MNSAPPTVKSPTRRTQTRLQRWLLVVVGVLCVALAAVGVVVPGLPTTVFVLIASYCFTRSCPWLEERLLRNRLFARPMRYVDGELSLTATHRLAIASIIVLFAGSSALLLHFGGASWVWPLAVVLFGLIGIVAVALWRREAAPAATSATR